MDGLEWKNMVSVEVTSSIASGSPAADQAPLEIDAWYVKLRDYNDPLTLAGCLWLADDWRTCFSGRAGDERFCWRFNGKLESSGNPYFELLFRILRQLCFAFNNCSGDSVEPMEEWRMNSEECLKKLESGEQRCHKVCCPRKIDELPSFHQDCVNTTCFWRDHNFFTALFCLLLIKKNILILADGANELAGNFPEATNEQFVFFHARASNLKRAVHHQRYATSNPLSILLPYVTFLEKVDRFVDEVLTACNALITSKTAEYEAAVLKHAQNYQPSFLRILRSKGYALSELTTSGKCHEADRDERAVEPALFPESKSKRRADKVSDEIELENILLSFDVISPSDTIPKFKALEYPKSGDGPVGTSSVNCWNCLRCLSCKWFTERCNFDYVTL